MKKIIIGLAVGFVFCSGTSAGENSPLSRCRVRTVLRDGHTLRREVKCEHMPDGAWRCRVKMSEIRRTATHIDIVNGAAEVPKGEGYWVDGNGRFGYLNHAEEARLPGKRRVGERMKMFGLKTPKTCWVGIVKGLALEYSTQIVSSKSTYGVYPRFQIDRIEFDPYEDIVVDFYELTGDDANYSGMAKKYRAYMLSEGGCRPLAERVKGNEALEWSAKSIFMRCKLSNCKGHCRDYPGYAMPPLVVNRTFDDYMKLMKQVKDMGMDYVDMCIVGWNYLGFDGPFPQLFPVLEQIGGEEKMKEAIAYGKSLGYRMSVHVNNHNIYRAAKERWRSDDVCKGENGQNREYGFLQGGLAYFTCFQVVNNRWIDEDLEKLKALGLNGIHHVDVTSARYPTACHDPQHPNNRAQEAKWQIATALKARAMFGGYSSESSFDHIAPALDNALYVSTFPTGSCPADTLVDGEIPTWQIAYNGIIMSQPFWSTVDPGYHQPKHPFDWKRDWEKMGPESYINTAEARVLKVIEYGGRPMFYFQNYSTLEPMKRMYDIWQPLKHLQYVFIDSHGKLAEGVYRTRYENGEEIVVNYSGEPFAYRGKSVKPMGFERFVAR